VLISGKCQHDVAYTQLIYHIRKEMLTQKFSPGEGEGMRLTLRLYVIYVGF
jgi:hypothetical protein